MAPRARRDLPSLSRRVFVIIGLRTVESRPPKGRQLSISILIVIPLLGFCVGHRSFGVMSDDLTLDLGVCRRWDNLLANQIALTAVRATIDDLLRVNITDSR